MAYAVAGATVSGTLAATGVSDSFRPIPNKLFNTFLSNTWTGTAVLQRSFDDGTTWLTVPKPDLTDASFTANVNFEVIEASPLMIYRWSWTRTTGSLDYRFGQ